MNGDCSCRQDSVTLCFYETLQGKRPPGAAPHASLRVLWPRQPIAPTVEGTVSRVHDRIAGDPLGPHPRADVASGRAVRPQPAPPPPSYARRPANRTGNSHRLRPGRHRVMAMVLLGGIVAALMGFQFQSRHLEAYAAAHLYSLVTPAIAASSAPIIWFGLGSPGAFGLVITPDCSSALLIAPLCLLGVVSLISRKLAVDRVMKALPVAAVILVAGNLTRIGVIALAQAVALLMSVAFISYALIIVVPYLRYRPAQAGDARTLAWHLFVPTLNEERVIGATIDYLRATFPQAHVWVIDDDSDDDTASIVGMRAWADPMVHLVRRYGPAARTGKGDALNSAYLALDQWLSATADSARTIIGVINADGGPRPTASTCARVRACSATRKSVRSRSRCGCWTSATGESSSHQVFGTGW